MTQILIIIAFSEQKHRERRLLCQAKKARWNTARGFITGDISRIG